LFLGRDDLGGLDTRIKDMSDTEDYPGPSHGHPEKKGQDPRGRANEDMTKPSSRPLPEKVQRPRAKAPGTRRSSSGGDAGAIRNPPTTSTHGSAARRELSHR
jgi:hypothetical protein